MVQVLIKNVYFFPITIWFRCHRPRRKPKNLTGIFPYITISDFPEGDKPVYRLQIGKVK